MCISFYFSWLSPAEMGVLLCQNLYKTNRCGTFFFLIKWRAEEAYFVLGNYILEDLILNKYEDNKVSSKLS